MKKFRGESIGVNGRAVGVAGGDVTDFQEGESGPGENNEVLTAAYHFKGIKEQSLELDCVTVL